LAENGVVDVMSKIKITYGAQAKCKKLETFFLSKADEQEEI